MKLYAAFLFCYKNCCDPQWLFSRAVLSYFSAKSMGCVGEQHHLVGPATPVVCAGGICSSLPEEAQPCTRTSFPGAAAASSLWLGMRLMHMTDCRSYSQFGKHCAEIECMTFLHLG